MREAMGGSMLFYILIPVLFLFIFFIAFIMNYASAYRASNYIITKIEMCNANMNNCAGTTFNTIKQDVKEKYHYTRNIDYCYIPNSKGTVYRATLYVAFDVPLLGDNLIAFPVRTESKTIYNVNENTNASGIPMCK